MHGSCLARSTNYFLLSVHLPLLRIIKLCTWSLIQIWICLNPIPLPQVSLYFHVWSKSELFNFSITSGSSTLHIWFKSDFVYMHPPKSKYIEFGISFKSKFDAKVLHICMSLNTPSNHNKNKAAGGPNTSISAVQLKRAGALLCSLVSFSTWSFSVS